MGINELRIPCVAALTPLLKASALESDSYLWSPWENPFMYECLIPSDPKPSDAAHYGEWIAHLVRRQSAVC